MNSKELAQAHWDYVKDLLVEHGEKYNVLSKIEFHYKSAFIHGFKHGVETTKMGQLNEQ